MLVHQSNVLRFYDEEFGFETFFNPMTGEYLRSGLYDDDGTETNEDPFMASFPHLLDVGIMGHCNHGLSGKCSEAGIACYQSGSSLWEPNMSYTDFKEIVRQSKGKVMQFALGGRGDPDQHENFEEILALSRENSIVPNLTTSGFELTKEKAALIGKYCGAAAVSWYHNNYTQNAIDVLLATGIRVNIHFVLSRSSIDEAIHLLEKEAFPQAINRVIFLLYKPVGHGRLDDVLTCDAKTKYFFSLMDTDYGIKKMGFDSCSVPGVLHSTLRVDPHCYDSCESGRFSAYITPNMTMLPCSFDQDEQWGISLRQASLSEAWRSNRFDDFRDILRHACPTCSKRESCFGGCPLQPSITLCDDLAKGR